jgi:hypothetical protein
LLDIAQGIIDSKVGQVLGTTLHTLGAIGLLGGLIGYVSWHRHLQKGHHHANVLHFATFLSYISILVNLLGGFMRTYETGHPHITDFASSAWVRAISIKHVFIFLGMGASVFLFERVAPRHLKAMWDGKLPQESMTGHNLGVLLVALGIVVAAVLGAVSGILPLPAKQMPEPEGEAAKDAYFNATGTFQSSPLAPGTAGGDLVVPAGVHDIEFTLTWTPTQTNLGLQLRTPSGIVAKSFSGTGGSLEGNLDATPVAGTWTYELTSPDPVVNVAWTVQFHMPAGNATAHGH